MFISNEGEVFPSGFLQMSVGNVTREDPIAIYQNAELFKVLRAADSFGGRCGHCTYRSVCGGSRARAWAVTRSMDITRVRSASRRASTSNVTTGRALPRWAKSYTVGPHTYMRT